MGRSGHTQTFIRLDPKAEYINLDMSVDTLPLSVMNDSNCVFIYLDNMVADVDLTGWMPTGLKEGAKVQFYKNDSSPFKIIINDPISGKPYGFVNKETEFICLHKFNNNLHI